jgi:hypothetical protein
MEARSFGLIPNQFFVYYYYYYDTILIEFIFKLFQGIETEEQRRELNHFCYKLSKSVELKIVIETSF